MKKKVIKIILIIFALFITTGGIYLLLDLTHWSMKSINDETVVLLPKPIQSIKDGLPYAEEKAKTWRKDVVLSTITVRFKGKDSVESRKGIISYEFYVWNKSRLGFEFNNCIVDIDMGKQAIINFKASGGLQAERPKLDISKWKIDIDETFDIVEKNIGTDVINKFNNPTVLIRTWNDSWRFSTIIGKKVNISGTEEEIAEDDTAIDIDVQTGKILKVKKTQM